VPAVDDKRRPDVSEIHSGFVYENWHTLQQAFASKTPGNKKQMQQRADTSATTDNNNELITTEYSCTSVFGSPRVSHLIGGDYVVRNHRSSGYFGVSY